MNRYLWLALFWALLLLPSASVSAAENWEVGLARRKITPVVPVFLSGYASRDKPFEEVLEDIYVKALALKDDQGHVGLLVTSDLIGFQRGVEDKVCELIQEKTQLDRAQILLSSSHTHTGPMIFLDVNERSEQMTEEQAQQTVAYTEKLIELTVEAALEALHHLHQARLSYGVGVCEFAMNRREWTPNGIRLGFNPGGYVDRSVPVLRIEDREGNLKGVLFGAATHNTTLTGKHFVISGDYAGRAQQLIQKEHPGVQAMFILGCAGSANPHPRGTIEDVQQHGQELATEVERVLKGRLAPVEGPLTTLFTNVQLPLQKPPTREEIDQLLSQGGGWRRFVAKRMIEILESGEELPRTFEAPLAVWQFGDDLTLVGLSGEVVNEYVPLIRESLGSGQLWIAAYTNHVFGYVPTAQILKVGGYETRGLYGNTVGIFSPNAEKVLVDAVRDLAAKAGRP
jgi:hypothetical protein